jgi:hypothetical protein
MKALDFENADEIGNPERYLLGLSLTPTPNAEMLNGKHPKSKQNTPE